MGTKDITHSLSKAEAYKSRRWLLVDAAGVPLGRLASQVVALLRGKHKPTYTRHVDGGDFVIVTNADKTVLTGSKNEGKMYFFHSGYIGHIKRVPAGKMLATKPEKAIKLAVKRMLPRGPLGYQMMTKLKVYSGAAHPHKVQKPEAVDLKTIVARGKTKSKSAKKSA